MSEQQADYMDATEPDDREEVAEWAQEQAEGIDVGPTPGPYAKGATSAKERRIVEVMDGNDPTLHNRVHVDIHSKRHPVQGQEPVANADLILAAFQSGEEAQQMGYDPVRAQRSTPGLLVALKEIADGHETPKQVAKDALASAEG